MKSTLLILVVAATLFVASHAPAATLKPELAGVAFLVGDWVGGRGRVAATGGTSAGSSVVTIEAGGTVLLRRDHTELFDASGKPAGGFDQIMMIYPDGGTLRADYADGDHVIRYASAVVDPGRSVVLTSAAAPGAPIFRLAYALSSPTTLTVAFSMASPGGSEFRSIAAGTLARGAGGQSGR